MSQNVNETLMAVTNTAITLKGHTTAPVMLALSLICTKMKMGQLVRVNTGLLLTTTHVTVRNTAFVLPFLVLYYSVLKHILLNSVCPKMYRMLSGIYVPNYYMSVAVVCNCLVQTQYVYVQ